MEVSLAILGQFEKVNNRQFSNPTFIFRHACIAILDFSHAYVHIVTQTLMTWSDLIINLKYAWLYNNVVLCE